MHRHAGAWGVYDPQRCEWINFRDSEADAYRLCAELADLDRDYTEEEYDALYMSGELPER